MITLADIWRYPIKGVGREPLKSVTLSEDATMPGDRVWAIAHEAARTKGGWAHCSNFARGTKAPGLQAITAKTAVDGQINLIHPDLAPLTLSLPDDAERLIAWLEPIWPADRPALSKIVTAPNQGMTDSSTKTVSIMNHASLRALSEKAGHHLQAERFRGNLWMEGAAPWEEFDLIGKTITLGPTTMQVLEPITRCLATHANPETGRRDAQVLDYLRNDWGHQEFGVLAQVTTPGTVTLSDELRP